MSEEVEPGSSPPGGVEIESKGGEVAAFPADRSLIPSTHVRWLQCRRGVGWAVRNL